MEWLPKDPAFKNVRIHTYGYDSDYLKGKDDCLNIHHIGKAFLGEISTSPHLAGSRTHIVAIGHSMGGLVIKKAYILAKQEAAHNTLASRIAAIYFLATPHRGADSAKTLKSLLRVVYDRAYVGDLERNSGAIQVINDEFRHVSKPLELWSFYETQTMNLFGSTIVDPESAVLGYSEEKQMPMNADHRSICKFETQFDANYIILRNALASTVTMITETIPGLELKENRNQIKDVRNGIVPLARHHGELCSLEGRSIERQQDTLDQW
ncbi:putative nacht and wd domain protein [Phaeoacremonium minimum UCRPA7]|uniref:Putative nacht and wd domain protein n=1 Tax=Phaeoacremonium minimum (strain UCR-PA7) TaxID=1286976 RepID=R8BXR5_PHAM7|nr:putative nacht and wd domain protein [Phaeoacremonium minimum UCRPA7]EOO04132.1 putative nacht and wd domain protein [Phaeoacremonium minimum UCRPA7]